MFFKDSLSTTMQHAPKRRLCGPRNPEFLVGTGGLHKSALIPGILQYNGERFSCGTMKFIKELLEKC